jgi:hypothetical protein
LRLVRLRSGKENGDLRCWKALAIGELAKTNKGKGHLKDPVLWGGNVRGEDGNDSKIRKKKDAYILHLMPS